MQKKVQKFVILGSLVFIILFTLTACGVKEEAKPIAEKPHLEFTIAGSGSNLPITQRLIDGYTKMSGQAITLPKSIGSGGAMKAIQNNAIDLGLISRPLKPAELEQGLKQIPYARIAVVIGVNPSVQEEQVTGADLIEIFKGTKTKWSNGQPIIVFSREEGDSTNDVLSQEIPGFIGTLADSLKAKRWQVFYTDAEEAQAVIQTRNSIGFTDSSALEVEKYALKPLLFNGVKPNIDNVTNGTYPLSKDLYFVYKEPLSERAQTFLEYVKTDGGQAIIRSAQGIPLGK